MSRDAVRLANRLKHRHLMLLVNIDRHKSLTRVAAQTGISQPAVTKALAELEDIFGAPLFLRTGSGLQPTQLGNLALVRARHMLSDLDLWEREVEALQAGAPRTCTWAWSRTCPAPCLPPPSANCTSATA